MDAHTIIYTIRSFAPTHSFTLDLFLLACSSDMLTFHQRLMVNLFQDTRRITQRLVILLLGKSIPQAAHPHLDSSVPVVSMTLTNAISVRPIPLLTIHIYSTSSFPCPPRPILRPHPSSTLLTPSNQSINPPTPSKPPQHPPICPLPLAHISI